ncbi:conserved Plasmodium protein, unknown function [Plasmodium berghei]|uniref:Uncharacterized protein n=2 Tax=Plasmodium berghei TaxID=5821 RepID=A0A509ANS6_PLABA|nr:conserved Plasmodium protein, unknown function [Plasmodium berghei ANKA]CXI61278.1 conserved Plasmodium protein, unknown function [Plasmodium berghei]SCM23632.1 conserved Plasmodium protein, unknown function [Plasmodium berghei]SCN26695.1 conserved Plasmodium protein, unknown function [Plasmodium berghei]SCO60984.1 conserved Plasmodium protein, unknown function [Plasmodium berghei]SCO63068.1 conserved Plasmodium protein, unknown function [Plasmodium berghei]|eukprot:XP_034422311.1 conserved Plasmodium protein, unknown function [Plasmodium berghei ANKA]
MEKNNVKDNAFKEKNESIIPRKNKQIMPSHCYRNCIVQNTFSGILKPVEIQYNDLLNPNTKSIHNIIFLRKNIDVSNHKNNKHQKTRSNDNKDQNNLPNVCNIVESHPLIDHENFVIKKTLKNMFFQRKINNAYSTTEITNKSKPNAKFEGFDYAMYNGTKNEHVNKLPVIKLIESKNNFTISNNTYLNSIKTLNYSSIIYCDINKRNLSPKTRNINKDIIKNYSDMCIENDNVLVNEFKNIKDDNNKKINVKSRENHILCVDHENVFKNNSLSLIETHENYMERTLSENNAVHRSVYFKTLDNLNPFLNKRIKKAKKKNGGACFCSFNNFSFQFLMSCDKT